MSFRQIDTTQAVEILPHKDLPILHSQYHGIWCPGNARSQGINNYYINYAESDQFGLRALRIKIRHMCLACWCWISRLTSKHFSATTTVAHYYIATYIYHLTLIMIILTPLPLSIYNYLLDMIITKTSVACTSTNTNTNTIITTHTNANDNNSANDDGNNIN